MDYGYARVSAKDQNEARQLSTFTAHGITTVFVDKASGKDFDRPEYKRMMRKLKAGDCVFVVSLDRLGRDYVEIQEQWRIITKKKKAHVCVMDMPLLDTRRGGDLLGTFIADLILQILAYVAQTEREAIRKRAADGIVCAQARGVRFGRPRWIPPDGWGEVLAAYQRGDITCSEGARRAGMTYSNFRYHAGKEKPRTGGPGLNQKESTCH